MQPSAQGIASMFMGNPGALAARVDQDRKQSPMGIPDDLRQLMALNIVTNETDAAKRQQAMNELQQMAPNGQPPTVADSVRQQAAQKLQARMVQEQQKAQAMQQMVQGLPAAGIPQGVPQPERQPQGIDEAPVEFGMASGGIVSFQEGGQSDDPIEKAKVAAKEREAEYERRIGAPDFTQYNRLMSELEKRRAAAAGPQAGIAGLTEYLAQIAATPRGLSSFEAGAAGARGVQALEREREATRAGLMDKQIELEQKKIDASRQYAKDMFGVGTSEFDRMLKANMDLFKEAGENDRLAKKHANEKILADLKYTRDIELEDIKTKNRMREIAAGDRLSADERVSAKAERISTGKETFNGESGPEAADKYIESISKSAAARLGSRYSGPDKTFEREVKLQQLYANDPQLKSFADALALAEMGNQPQRVERLRNAINDRKAELSATLPTVPGKPGTQPAPAGDKVMTMADVRATAQKHGKTEAEVVAAAKARGFTIKP